MRDHLAERKVKDCSAFELICAASDMCADKKWQFMSLFITEMGTEILTATNDTDKREMVNCIMQKINEDP